MEQKSTQEQEPRVKDKLFSRSTLIIIGIALALNVGVMTVLVWSKVFPGTEGEKAQKQRTALEEIALVDLGRVEVRRPTDAMQQNFTHCSASVQLQVPATKAAEVEAVVGRLGPKFRELARQAFLDVDAQDLLMEEKLAPVRNSIKNRVNQQLGQDVVSDVIFGDYKSF